MHNELKRLTLPGALQEETYRKPFNPVVSELSGLPVIDWKAVGSTAPIVLDTPSELPQADAIVITWANAEWAAMQHVFCSGNQSMPYNEKTTGSWPGWEKYSEDLPKVNEQGGWSFWGYYRLVQVGSKNVLLFKSNTHLDFPGEQYLKQMISILIAKVKPGLIMSIGTAGGARLTDPVGTVNAVNAGTLYAAGQPESEWPEYGNDWAANWHVINNPNFNKLLFPVPANEANLTSIAKQFNKFYNTDYPLDVLDINNLNAGVPAPAVNNLTGNNTSLLTTNTFVVATSSGSLSDFACVEMDDAIIAETCKEAGTAFGFVRNISDPVQNVSLPAEVQGSWGSAIYSTFGFYSSYNGAIAAWAILST